MDKVGVANSAASESNVESGTGASGPRKRGAGNRLLSVIRGGTAGPVRMGLPISSCGEGRGGGARSAFPSSGMGGKDEFWGAESATGVFVAVAAAAALGRALSGYSASLPSARGGVEALGIRTELVPVVGAGIGWVSNSEVPATIGLGAAAGEGVMGREITDQPTATIWLAATKPSNHIATVKVLPKTGRALSMS